MWHTGEEVGLFGSKYFADHPTVPLENISAQLNTTNLHPDYHRVADSVEKIDFEKMAHIAQLVYETGRRVANLDHLPVRDSKGPHLALTQ